jgi:sugar lactone lactonase YvrE
MKKLLFTLILISFYTIKSQNIYTIAGNGSPATSGDGGPAINAELYRPTSLGIDLNGNIYSCEFFGPIRKINTQGVISTYTPLNTPNIQVWDIAFDASNNMYCCLTSKIIKITPSGTTLTIVGTGTAGYSGDGGPAINAKINGAKGLAFDATGNIYFADQNNYRIRKIDLAGNISTITGNGGSGYSGDGGPAISAQIGSARGIAIDVAGNIFIAESTRIRKINAAGIISTIAQNMNSTTGVTIDASGNIFFSTLNQINKINSIGLITTIAGNTSTGFSGDGGPAINCKLWWPDDLEFNSQGNLYVADTHNNRIRLICFNSCAVGVNELDNSNKNQLSIYPNPSGNNIQLNTEANFNSIEIINSFGQLVLKQNFTNSISIENLNRGIYFIHLFDAQNKLLATKKFIKE